MLQLPENFKTRALEALLEARKNYDGSDSAFAKTWNINSSVYSRIKNGEPTEGLLKDSHWIHIGRELGISTNERQWKMARTEVFTMIEQDVLFCKEYSKGRICVDDCGIGKTFTAKYLSRSIKNCFYVDASQAKSKQLFIRLIARQLGIDSTGKYVQVKSDLKYYIKMLPQPIIIIDEAGDLEYTAFLELKELWNATESACGWYLMGADGLRSKITKGISNKKVGFRELFSRYSERYTTIVPVDRREKTEFYKNMITQVLSVNMPNKAKLNEVVRRCLTTDDSGNIGGLRRAESLLNILS
jgi:hypothetical protein